MKPLTDAQKRLAAEHYETIDRAARGSVNLLIPKGVRRHVGEEDLLQEARVAGMRAVAAFVPGRCDLMTFVLTYVRNRLLSILRDNVRHAAALERFRNAATPAPEPRDPGENVAAVWEETAPVRRGMSPLQRLWLRLMVSDGWTRQQVADAWGITPQRVSEIVARGRAECREHPAAADMCCTA
jgi:RNA polymerase sigma factor (sigma-70 family)